MKFQYDSLVRPEQADQYDSLVRPEQASKPDLITENSFSEA
jgi:hypothetical protein